MLLRCYESGCVLLQSTRRGMAQSDGMLLDVTLLAEGDALGRCLLAAWLFMGFRLACLFWQSLRGKRWHQRHAARDQRARAQAGP